MASVRHPVLWIDLRYDPQAVSVGEQLQRPFDLQRVIPAPGTSTVEQAISTYRPRAVCFDYDIPDRCGLAILQALKARFPCIPVLMLVRDRSPELSVWALRARVWDYFIKPVGADELIGSLDAVIQRLEPHANRPRKNLMPAPAIPEQIHKRGGIRLQAAPAIHFIADNLDRKIALSEAAARCGMSPSHFSRTFKKEYGVTFQEYVIQQRIDKAVQLLKYSNLQITQIAFAVGFSQLSNFTKTYLRYVGIHPTSYRKAVHQRRTQGADQNQEAMRFPSVNPHPVLSCGPDGGVQFVNPAARHLMGNTGQASDILPEHHAGLVKACLRTRTSLTAERRAGERMIVWSYQPVEGESVLYLYGHDVSRYMLHDKRADCIAPAADLAVHDFPRFGTAGPPFKP